MMKTKKQWVCLFTMGILCVSLAACGGDTKEDDAKGRSSDAAAVTVLQASAKEIAAKVQSGVELTGASWIASDEPDADLTLMFNYGVEEDEQVDAIEDYVLSTITSNDYPYYFGVIRCKEGTDKAVIDAIAETVRNSYPQDVIHQMAKYNGAWSAVAEGFTLKTYDNGVVVAAYDTEGNDAVISLVEEACRAAQ